MYALRRRDFNLLLDDMRLLIDDFRPTVVIVDGIVEFVASFNDESMAKNLIHDLLCISEDYRLAMVYVLHTKVHTRTAPVVHFAFCPRQGFLFNRSIHIYM